MNRRSTLLGSLILLTAGASSAAAAGAEPSVPAKARAVLQGIGERGALVLAEDLYGDRATRIVYLDQGWGPAETLWFYHADQGSVLLPYQTLIHLEQADNERPFIQTENLARFRFLTQHKTPNNPDALPVGFSRHDDQVGLTCAACHTAQINYRGTAMRIDGAQALADITGFFLALQAALTATLADEAKLTRFVAAQPGAGHGAAAREAARQSLTATLRWFESYNTVNHTATAEGFGRLDAIDRIINQAIRFTSDPKNSIQASAPASFPVLWDAPRHDYVQWTGFSSNAGAGSLGRNAGEVLGVFGHIQVKHYETEKEAKKGYQSTVTGNALVAMEESLRRLKSPRWPETILPPIDRQLAARGESLYKAQCQSCHAAIDREDPQRKVVAIITGIDLVGTDDTSARNLLQARAPAGILEGAISPKGEKYGPQLSALALIGDLVTRTLAAQPTAAVRAVASAKLHGLTAGPKHGDHPQPTDQNPTADLMAYKARPLNGVWASAPYLHNGSVPTLYDLLLPPAERPRQFAVGRWEYDPRKVGYVSAGQVPFVVDTSVVGNSNRGHEYGVKLADADRWALVEYMKTL